MLTQPNPAIRIGAAIAASLAALLILAAIIRPEMMTMPALRNLIVGFGL